MKRIAVLMGLSLIISSCTDNQNETKKMQPTKTTESVQTDEEVEVLKRESAVLWESLTLDGLKLDEVSKKTLNQIEYADKKELISYKERIGSLHTKINKYSSGLKGDESFSTQSHKTELNANILKLNQVAKTYLTLIDQKLEEKTARLKVKSSNNYDSIKTSYEKIGLVFNEEGTIIVQDTMLKMLGPNELKAIQMHLQDFVNDMDTIIDEKDDIISIQEEQSFTSASDFLAILSNSKGALYLAAQTHSKVIEAFEKEAREVLNDRNFSDTDLKELQVKMIAKKDKLIQIQKKYSKIESDFEFNQGPSLEEMVQQAKISLETITLQMDADSDLENFHKIISGITLETQDIGSVRITEDNL